MVHLAGNPTQDPLVSKSATLQSGKKINLVDPSATRALIALMDMQAVLGGAASHFGGPSAFAELMSAVWGFVFDVARAQQRPWFELFNMVNDAGHCENGWYALKALTGHAGVSMDELKTFRKFKSRLTGHAEVHMFREGVYLSNGPLGSVLPQAQGLAMADRLSQLERVTVVTVSDGGLMEGEAREALAAIPGLAQVHRMNPFVMVISDNNTKLTGRIDKDSFSMSGTFLSLKDLGWRVLELDNGQDLQRCLLTFEHAFELAKQNTNQPVAIHAKTIKGYGIQACVESTSGGHGFPIKDPSQLRSFLKEIFKDRSIPDLFQPWLEQLENEGLRRSQTPKPATPLKKQKIQVGVSQALIRLKERGFPIVSVTADLPGSTGLLEFQKKYPDSTFDVGVAESNMISVAAGFSKQGYIPVVDTFAQFGATKGALPLTMAALSEAPVIAIFSHTGFQDAADGASHQALSYLAQTGAIPHTNVYALTSSSEAETLITQAVEVFDQQRKAGQVPPNMVFYLGREDFLPQLLPIEDVRLGQAQIVCDTTPNKKNNVLIVTAGSLVPQAVKAAEELQAETSLGAVVINISCLNHPDVSTVAAALDKCEGRLITVEDHQVQGGLGSFLLPPLIESGAKVQTFVALGVRDAFGQSAYQAADLYRAHQLDHEAILKACHKIFD